MRWRRLVLITLGAFTMLLLGRAYIIAGQQTWTAPPSEAVLGRYVLDPATVSWLRTWNGHFQDADLTINADHTFDVSPTWPICSWWLTPQYGCPPYRGTWQLRWIGDGWALDMRSVNFRGGPAFPLRLYGIAEPYQLRLTLYEPSNKELVLVRPARSNGERVRAVLLYLKALVCLRCAA